MKIKDYEIEVPDHKPLIKKLNSLSTMNLYFISRYQKEKKFYPNSNAGCEDYCLYLGSLSHFNRDANGNDTIEECDLWHYPYYNSEFPRYSTAIIFGNEGGNYKSGWPSLALKYEDYRRLMYREVVCGLVSDPKIIMKVGLAALNLRPDMSDVQYNTALNEAGGGVDSYRDYEDEGYDDPDWWQEHWWEKDFEEQLNKS